MPRSSSVPDHFAQTLIGRTRAAKNVFNQFRFRFRSREARKKSETRLIDPQRPWRRDRCDRLELLGRLVAEPRDTLFVRSRRSAVELVGDVLAIAELRHVEDLFEKLGLSLAAWRTAAWPSSWAIRPQLVFVFVTR